MKPPKETGETQSLSSALETPTPERHVPRSCCAEVPHAGSSDTDRYPDAASGALADGRRAGTAGRTPERTTARGFMHQMNVNFPISHLQLDAVHTPGGLNP